MSTQNRSALYKSVAEKRNILRDRYGGMMSRQQLAKELGFKKTHNACKWAEEVGLDATIIGSRKKYDTDKLAEILVLRRGMA